MSAIGSSRTAVEPNPLISAPVDLKKTLLIAGAALSIADAAAFGWRWGTSGRYFVSTNDAPSVPRIAH